MNIFKIILLVGTLVAMTGCGDKDTDDTASTEDTAS
jgi:predicted small lipoprotein YifL